MILAPLFAVLTLALFGVTTAWLAHRQAARQRVQAAAYEARIEELLRLLRDARYMLQDVEDVARLRTVQEREELQRLQDEMRRTPYR